MEQFFNSKNNKIVVSGKLWKMRKLIENITYLSLTEFMKEYLNNFEIKSPPPPHK